MTHRTLALAGAALLFCFQPASAQDHHHDMHAMGMMSGPLGISDKRLASGTAWQPDSTPMYGLHLMRGSWMLTSAFTV